MFEQITQAVSLALTSPTLLTSTLVVVLWFHSTYLFFLKAPEERTSYDWLIVGIFIGFLGNLLDNTFWGTLWSGKFFGQVWIWNAGMKYGSLSNIVFRQIADTAAAYCHLRGYCVSKRIPLPRLHNAILISIAVGVLYTAVGLLIFAPYGN